MRITEITPVIKNQNKKIRLAPYCRVSSDSKDQLHSFAAQIRYYSEYEKKHPEYILVDIYADEGITGTEMEKRDELLRLIRDCKKGLIDRIITKTVARFARNLEELLEITRLLKSLGVSVYFEEQGIDTEKLNMELLVTFPGMAAQQESENISGNMRLSYKARMEMGEFNCTCPAYGFELINGEMVINESEAMVIRRIFDLYLQGIGLQNIARLLNEEKIPRRYGKTEWQHRTIRYILTNERYKGDAILQKRFTTETLPFRRVINQGEYPLYHIENSNPAIVDKEIFDKVQELLKSRQNEPCNRVQYTLSRKLRCPECGKPFRRMQTAGKVYWYCMKAASGASNCQSRRVREDMVYDAFTRLVYKLKIHQKEIICPFVQLSESLQMRTSENQERIGQIDKEIANLSAKNLVITRLHTSGVLNSVEYSTQSSEISNRIAALRVERRKKMNEDGDEDLDGLKELDQIMDEYQLASRFDGELFGQIVKGIIVDSSKQITFRLMGGLQLTEIINEKGRCKSK